MRLSKKQQIDIDTIKYFIPTNTTFDTIKEADIIRFLAWSDKGIGGDSIKRDSLQSTSGISALYWGKSRRDLQVASYVKDWGKYINAIDFVEEPEFIVEWLSKVMKKPGIINMWKVFNRPDDLDEKDWALLEPPMKLANIKRSTVL